MVSRMTVERQLLLAGHLRGSDALAEVRSPWDGRPLARVAQAGPEDARFAAAAASAGFLATRRLPARRRAAILTTLAATLRSGREPLARLVSDEGGKPRRLARVEVDDAIAILERCAEDVHHVVGEISSSAGRIASSVDADSV
jgi:acyl-CoA reductase-like NAD-dependent aldehyde dehydrogenase